MLSSIVPQKPAMDNSLERKGEQRAGRQRMRQTGGFLKIKKDMKIAEMEFVIIYTFSRSRLFRGSISADALCLVCR
jgi:hypothetical protein